jgi:transporter family-2 protein
MPDIVYFLLMLAAGVGIGIQPLINSSLAARAGAVESSFISFVVGAAVLAAAAAAFGHGSIKSAATAPWWQFAGGFLGAFYIFSVIIAIPRIGALAAASAIIATQLITSAIIDHFGLFGIRQIPMDAWRVGGTVLLLIGAAMVFKG